MTLGTVLDAVWNFFTASALIYVIFIASFVFHLIVRSLVSDLYRRDGSRGRTTRRGRKQ